MKRRLLFQVLCVGAALLVPAGGLAVLGIGTAGASTATLVATSKVKLAPIGTMTMVGLTLFTKTAAVGTKQINITSQFPIVGAGTTLVTLVDAKLLVTIKTTAGVKSIRQVDIKSGASVAIKGGGYTGCRVSTLPAISYGKTTALKWTATNVTLSGVSVTGTCTTKSVLESDIAGHKISSTLTFSAA
jgi:hypothetical protein